MNIIIKKMLTEREKQVYELKLKGLTQLEISSKLNISQPAVSQFYNSSIKKINEANEILDYIKNLKKVGK
jgi:DNA-directed RNA polymerase specialized sigma subunit